MTFTSICTSEKLPATWVEGGLSIEVRSAYFWYRMSDDIKNWIRTCDVCQLRNQPGKPAKSPLQTYISGMPNERVALECARTSESFSVRQQLYTCNDRSFLKVYESDSNAKPASTYNRPMCSIENGFLFLAHHASYILTKALRLKLTFARKCADSLKFTSQGQQAITRKGIHKVTGLIRHCWA